MIRKVLTLLLLPVALMASPAHIKLKCQSAIMIDADTGAVLFEKRAKEARYPASLTKMATCIHALKMARNRLDTPVAAVQDCIGAVSEDEKRKSGYKKHPPHWLVFDACHIGIKKGEILSLNDLIYGMMVASADDASNIIAHHLSGSVPKFMKELNEEMKLWGCEETHFLNPHGLHHPHHKSTAYDLALIAKAGMEDPLFRKIVTTKTHQRPKTNKQDPVPLVQTNRLLKKGKHAYEHAIGIKTGTTSDAGCCLAAAAHKDGRTLITVVLGGKEKEDPYIDTKALFEAAFQEQRVTKQLLSAGPQSVTLEQGKNRKVHTETHEPIEVSFFPSEGEHFHLKLHLQELNEPPKAGDQVGTLYALNHKGEKVASTPLFASHIEKSSWAFPMPSNKMIFGSVVGLLFLFILLKIFKRGPKERRL